MDLPVLHVQFTVNAGHLGVVGPLTVGAEICTDSANTQEFDYQNTPLLESYVIWIVCLVWCTLDMLDVYEHYVILKLI